MPNLLPAGRVGLRVEGRGPPIVLLHSSMSSKSQWRVLIESLRDRYRFIAIDLLGYCESAMPGDSYSLHDEVRLVESVLARELQPGEQFHLIGHSYGGVIALQLAAQTQSQRVRSLSLFEPIAFHLLPAGDPDLAVVEELRREIAGRLNGGDAHGGAGVFVDYWSGAGAFAQLRETRQLALAAQVPKVLREFRAVADELRATNYRRIEVPACLVAGLWSPEPAHRLISMLADILPHASCFEVAAGHMAPITHPALVNPIFEEFIRAVDASDSRSLAIPPFSEMTAVVRGHGWSRAIAVGLLGIAVSLLPFAANNTFAHGQFGMSMHAVYPLEDDAWHEATPGLPPGGTFAVISGDPNEEQLIVLAGAITVGTGGASGATHTRTLTSGSYVSLPANEIHFANTKSGAIVQIFGIGPFELEPT